MRHHSHRQTYLGASPQKTLCIMPYPHHRRFVPTGECFLHRMPNELLCRILEYLAPARTSLSGSAYEPCLPIPLVCRRWERLYCYFLYRNIDLGLSGWMRLRRIRQLEATLRQRPDLCDAVRKVGIQYWRPREATCELLANILSYCKGLRNFELHTGWTQSTWIILHAVNKAQLATLKLSGLEGGPSLQMILKHFSLPTLKEVSLNRYGLCSGDEPGAPWYASSDTAPEDLGLLLASASPCNVTTMELDEPSAPAHVTKSFLQWPARLTSLTMTSMHSTRGAEYTVDTVQGILDDHRHTLQHIRLGTLARGIECLPDFSSFTSLESLQIHWLNLFMESPRRAATKLDAPRLRHLRINFDTEDKPGISPDDFGSDRIDWLKGFVGHISLTTTRLETVFIAYEPDVLLADLQWIYYETWPWHYIDQAVGLFAGHNVTMTYTQPCYSRKEWDQAVEQTDDARRPRKGLIHAHFTALNV